MAKLVSGRVEKVSSANVSADRYQFLSLQEAEPDLGLPASNGQVLASNTDGERFFVTLNTDNVTEADNLYYTNARVYSNVEPLLVLKANVSDLTTSNVTELDNLYYTNARVQAYISETDISTQNLTVAGNLIVQGETTTLNVANLIVEDKNILLANGALDASTADGGGITIEGANASIIYRETGDKFLVNKNVEITGNIVVNGTLIGNITGISAQTETLDNFTTSNLAEGTNLYYTNTRVYSNVAPLLELKANVVDLTTSNVVELNNLYYTNARVLSHLQESNVNVQDLTAVGNISAKGFITSGVGIPSLRSETNLNLSANGLNGGAVVIQNSAIRIRGYTTAERDSNVTPSAGDVIYNTTNNLIEFYDGTSWISLGSTDSAVFDNLTANTVTMQDVTVLGNLIVQGDTVTLNATTVTVEDKNLILANGAINAVAADGAGITIDGAQASIIYQSSSDTFVVNKSIETNVIGTVSSISNFTSSNLTEGNNLYYTNARVDARIAETSINALSDVNIDGITDGQILVWDSGNGTFIASSLEEGQAANIANVVLTLDNFTTSNLSEGINLYYTNTRVQAYLDEQNIGAVDLSANTTDDLSEGSSNLYYTNSRARAAFTAGLGIAISSAGVISAKGDDTGTGMFNSGINLSAGQQATDAFANVLSFSSNDGNSFIVYSFHVTNITPNVVYLSGRYAIDDKTPSNVVLFANLFPIPGDTSLELLRKPQVLKPGDDIQIISYSSEGIESNDLISVYVSYQASSDGNYNRVAKTITDNDLTEIFTTVNQTSIIESIVLNNLSSNVIPVTTRIYDESDSLLSYLTSNLRIPAKTSIEICEYPKSLQNNYKIKINKGGIVDDQLTVFITSKYTSFYDIQPVTSEINEGGSVVFNIETLNLPNGSVLYYTLETVSGTIDQTDFITPIEGTVTIDNDAGILTLVSNNVATSSFEGNEIFRLQLRKNSNTGAILAISSNVTIADTANTIGVSSLNTPVSIYETEQANVVINTSYAEEGEVLYYNVTGNADIYSNTTGNVEIFNNTANISIIAEASVPDNEIRVFAIQIRKDSISGNILGESNNIIVTSVIEGVDNPDSKISRAANISIYNTTQGETPPTPPTGYGWFGYGSIDRIQFTDDTSIALTRGSLSASRLNCAATGNDDYGWFGGGGFPSLSSVDRIDFAADTNTALLRGPLSLARNQLGAVSNDNYGWFAGGIASTYRSTVDRIDFADDTNAASVRGSIGFEIDGLAATGNDDYGWFGGGYRNPPSLNISAVGRTTFATDTNAATARGPLSLARHRLAATGNDNYGWFGGGFPGPVSTVDRIDFAVDTNTATVRSPLSIARYRFGAVSDNDYGWFGGGVPNSSVERITFSADTAATSVRGPLSSAGYAPVATSGIA